MMLVCLWARVPCDHLNLKALPLSSRGLESTSDLLQCAVHILSRNKKHWPKVPKRKSLLNDNFNNLHFFAAQWQSVKSLIMKVILAILSKFPEFSFVETKCKTELKINYKGAFLDLQLLGIATVQRLTFSFELWSSKVDRWKYCVLHCPLVWDIFWVAE